MASVENVVVTKFRADITDLTGKMDQVQKELAKMNEGADKAAGGFTTLKGSIAAAVGIAAVQAINKVVGALQGLAVDSFNAAARVEELEIVTNAVGKATGLGAKTIRDATTAIRNNGIEMAASQEIALTFARNNLELADASKVARVAQDLAVVSGQNSTETTQLLTQAIITGRTQLLKSAGIAKGAEMAYADYATAVGKAQTELTATEKQQAIVNMIMEEGQKVTGVYEASMTTAGKVMRSFARIINDIQIEIGGILTAAFGPFILALYDLMKAFSLAIREGGALRPVVDALTSAMVAVGKPIVTLVKALTEIVKSLGDTEKRSETLTSIMEVLQGAVAEVSSVFNGLSHVGRQLSEMFGGEVSRVLSFLAKGVIKFLIVQVASLVTGIAYLAKSAVGLFVNVANAAIFMTNGVIGAVNKFYEMTNQSHKMIKPLDDLTLSFDGVTKATSNYRDESEKLSIQDKETRKVVKETGGGFKKTGEESDKAAEKLKKMQDAFNALAKAANSAREDLTSLIRSVYGELSQLEEAFQPEGLDLKKVIKGTDELLQIGQKILAPLKAIGGATGALARQVEQQFNQTIIGIRDNFARLLKERQAVETALKVNEDTFKRRVEGINETFNALDKEAAARVKSLESYYDGLIKGLRVQLDGATKAFNDADNQLKALVADRKRALDGIAKGFRGFLNALSFKRAAEVAAKGVKDTGKVIETTVKDLGNGIRVTIQRELQPAMEQLSNMGADVPITAADIRAQLNERLRAISEFAANIRTLVSRGLDASLVQEFTEAGVSGAGDVVAALAGASQDEIAAINATQSQLAAEVAGFTKFASAQWYDSSIAQQEAIVAPLRISYEEAQAAVNNAELLRQAELTAANAQVQILREQRQEAIDAANKDYNDQRILLEGERDRIDAAIRQQATDLQAAMKNFGDQTVVMMEMAGNNSRKQFKEGFNKKFPDMKARLNAMMTNLAESMRRTTSMTVEVSYTGNKPDFKALGGPVRAQMPYVVGEQGPELFVPSLAGQIIPAGETRRALAGRNSVGPAMMSGGGLMGGSGNTYAISVNVPISANQSEIGRQLVDAIAAYERRNGKVYEPA